MTSGTQSPPLEATGEHVPMGISSVNNPDAKIEVVPDSEQRAQYFQEPTTVAQRRAAGNQKRVMDETVSAQSEREGRSID
ncbi:hypothetical protein BDM02DRAFT_3182512 [Thelephora ganbajun]|uniref:Uncharacterized protein n=1 Tax=Thelephora ganbajun TaxID=370292 RepID=A0ACB6ZV14_THEGA|nr:hypothetical protein BDM02DRAFT_3182512 [Thelephora ganbajun]